jgi:hypothetical protein
MTHPIPQRTDHGPADAHPRGAVRLTLAVAGLVLLNAVAGTAAILAGVNTPPEAWSSRALLAAPAPVIAAQAILAGIAYRWPDRRGALAAALLALACATSAVSAFFDGAFGNRRVPTGLVPVQWTVLAAAAAVAVLAARTTVRLWRPRPCATSASSQRTL